jgi:hypothetical protein
MTTVYVITAGSGGTCRIERIYLDRDEAYGFAQDYNGIAPIEPVQVKEWETGAPTGAYDGPYWRAQWWARVPVSKRRGDLRHTREGERRDDFDIRQEWWTGGALPEAKVVRRELARIPGWRWLGCRRRRWRNCSGRRSPRSGPIWRECEGSSFHCVVRRIERNGHGHSTLPPLSVMMAVWTNAPWNGSATTS